jgi:phosphopantothenoylcysteine decarboxylase/phosphopantothenate--cysteine ligase
MATLLNRKTLLIVGGGIAAYKSLLLIRRLQDKGAHVRCILTAAAQHFVAPLSVSALTNDKVFLDLFSLTDEAEMGHIQLSRDADLLVVAPATADLLAQMAQGLASDLATTALLATDKRVLVAPAMNVRMWHHPATQRNIATLKGDGVLFVGPGEGPMACGEFGLGRVSEPEDVVAAVEQALAGAADRPLAGRRALVTSGPTHEPIDPVRYIANRSSGKQGHAIAAALCGLGADTVLISGPVEVPTPPGVRLVRIESAVQMLHAVQAELPVDVAVFAAAVADWRVDGHFNSKIKKGAGGPPALRLVENPDVLATISRGERRPALVVGFAAETDDVINAAVAKRRRKGCDWIVANDVSPATGIMGGDRNTVHLVTDAGVEDWPTLDKAEVAGRLARRIAERLAS